MGAAVTLAVHLILKTTAQRMHLQQVFTDALYSLLLVL